jgi:lipid-binding SYLF domain-containing protein
MGIQELMPVAFSLYKNKENLTLEQFADKAFLDKKFQKEFDKLLDKARGIVNAKNGCSAS